MHYSIRNSGKYGNTIKLLPRFVQDSKQWLEWSVREFEKLKYSKPGLEPTSLYLKSHISTSQRRVFFNHT